ATWPTMSQGERGRALIARALLPDPPLLLLDEPSTGLDVAAREQFLSTLDELHRARPSLATILVTHHLEELPSSTTHALLIKDGRVNAAGRAQDVLTTGLVSECFDHPIGIEHRAGRSQAPALALRCAPAGRGPAPPLGSGPQAVVQQPVAHRGGEGRCHRQAGDERRLEGVVDVRLAGPGHALRRVGRIELVEPGAALGFEQ